MIVMVIYDTVANQRTTYTRRALASLHRTNLAKHRVFLVDNGSCQETKDLIAPYGLYDGWNIITLPENIGTAEGWNMAAKLRAPGEHVIKIDNDIVINNCADWIEQMEEVVRIDPKIGQVGLKRKDCIETTTNENPFYKSSIRQLPHIPGNRWIIVEQQFHVMGSCVLHSSDLLDSIGLMYQVGLYGFDDSALSARCIKAGFMPVMLPHIDIDHIDDGGNIYQKEKEALANKVWQDGDYKRMLYEIGIGKYYYDGITHELRYP